MHGMWANLTVDASEMRCYSTTPDSEGAFPDVIIWMQATGVDSFIPRPACRSRVREHRARPVPPPDRAIGRRRPPTRGSACTDWLSPHLVWPRGYPSERRRRVSISGQTSRSSRLSRIWPGARSRGTSLKPSF